MNKKQVVTPLFPTIVRKIWGGQRLSKIKGLDDGPDQEPVGETWEISIHPSGPSKTSKGDLSDFVNEQEMPYLVKLIDTSDYLSVQVHPDDEYAQRVESSSGKTECWLILDAEKGAGIYLGMKEGVTEEEFEKALKAGAKMDSFLNFYEVKRGDFFFVPAGTIHAIGKGVFLTEVQQSSGITYRVWDWNRVDSNGQSRELHVKKAMDVTNFDSDFNSAKNFKIQNSLLSAGKSQKLISHPQFEADLTYLEAGQELLLTGEKRATSLIVLEGEFDLEGNKALEYQSFLCSEKTHVKAIKTGYFIWIY